jgi:hypothetical protein
MVPAAALLMSCDSSQSATPSAKAESSASFLDVATAAPNALGVPAGPGGPSGDGKGQPVEGETAGQSANKVGKILVTDFDIDRTNPNLMEPCVFVAKNVWEKAEEKDKFQVEFKLTYNSGGKPVTRIQTIHLKNAVIHEHPGNPKPDKDKYVPLKATVDIGGQPLDLGSSVTVSATLYRAELQGESTFTGTAHEHEPTPH